MQVYITNNGIINVNYLNSSLTNTPPHNIKTNSSSIYSQQSLDDDPLTSFTSSSNQALTSQQKDINSLLNPPIFKTTKEEIDAMKTFVQTLNTFTIQTKSFPATTLPEILPITESHIDILKSWTNKQSYNILYRATKDGLSRRMIDKKVSGHSNTITLLQNNRDIYVAYFEKEFPMAPSSGHVFLNDKNHFIGILSSSSTIQPFQLHKSSDCKLKSLIVGALDEYIDKAFSCCEAFIINTNYTVSFSKVLSKVYVNYGDRAMKFADLFPSECCLSDVLIIEMI
ncbi:hypothetical protein QTN25_004171 [Entamoeba marina]